MTALPVVGAVTGEQALAIPMRKMTLPQSTLDSATRLMGFDYGEHLFHVLAFDFGDDGGAIGIWREGSEFCARISLDALAEFWQSAQDGKPKTTDAGRDLHRSALEIVTLFMNDDLQTGSPKWIAFDKFINAIEAYERATLPPPFGDATPSDEPLSIAEEHLRAIIEVAHLTPEESFAAYENLARLVTAAKEQGTPS